MAAIQSFVVGLTLKFNGFFPQQLSIILEAFMKIAGKHFCIFLFTERQTNKQTDRDTDDHITSLVAKNCRTVCWKKHGT